MSVGLRFDLHVHTVSSPDGMNTPRRLVRAAIRRGLSGVAVTDHNTVSGVASVRAAAPEGFTVIPGAEYSTDYGHVLALFCEGFPEDIIRDEKGRFPLAELSPFIRERGGLLIAAHPFQGRETLPGALFPLVDGLESVNARELSRSPASRAAVEKMAREQGKFVTGGGDAHLPMEIGQGYTVFPDIPDRASIPPQEALRKLKAALTGGLCAAEGKPGWAGYRMVTRLWYKARVRF
ncbi:MAG: PHP domain-containing protein [Clostridiales bacterium]|jgi:predicted metal-dependent phosphoesterase TrpH|nr:PHP domain-containing protein [Clostridiales bacterium]